jgi:hypothetical protein
MHPDAAHASRDTIARDLLGDPRPRHDDNTIDAAWNRSDAGVCISGFRSRSGTWNPRPWSRRGSNVYLCIPDFWLSQSPVAKRDMRRSAAKADEVGVWVKMAVFVSAASRDAAVEIKAE